MALPDPPPQATVAEITRIARTRAPALLREWWLAAARPRRYAGAGPPAEPRRPSELNLGRGLLHHLLAARSDHGDFEAYHKRFRHAGNHRFSCGGGKSTAYLAFCRITRLSQARWPTPEVDRNPGPAPTAPAQVYWDALLQDPAAFQQFDEVTGYFSRAGLRNSRGLASTGRTGA